MSGKPDEDPAWTLFLLLALIVIAVWIVWMMFGSQLLGGLRYFRIAEMSIINLFTDEFKPCINWLMLAQTKDAMPTPEAIGWASMCFREEGLKFRPPSEALEYYNMTLTSMGSISKKLSSYTRWPVVLFCGGVAFYALFLTPRNKFKVKHNLESFIKLQAKMWPVISPIVNFNPTKHSARIPGEPVPEKLQSFAEALSPEEWLAFHRIPVLNGIPDREATRRALQLQLGPRWNGIDDLPLHILAIFVAFALKGSQKREESDEMLGKIALCWSEEKGFVLTPELKAEIKKLAADPQIGGQALKPASKHAYRTTAMLGILKWARFMGGVLAPGQFVWLRAVDRDLWYPLNNLGRRSFHSEGAGAMAHFMAEQSAEKPLPIPRVDTAIVTINQYMGRGQIEIPPIEPVKK